MISVTISRKELVAHAACSEGVALFDALASQQPASDTRRLRRVRVVHWTALHQFWLCSAYPSFANWLRQEGLVPWVRFSNLSYSNLRGSNLSYSNLRGSNLSGSDLRGSNLRGSNLSYSNLSYSNLSYSNLSGSDLSYSDLSYSDLRYSDLRGSNLSYSNLSGSNLSGSYYPYGDLPDGWVRGSDGYLTRSPR